MGREPAWGIGVAAVLCLLIGAAPGAPLDAPAGISGTYESYLEEGVDGSESVSHFLIEAAPEGKAARVRRLRFEGAPPSGLRFGSAIRVGGSEEGGSVAVSSVEVLSGASAQVAVAPGSPVNIRVAAIMVDLQDMTTGVSSATVQDYLFGASSSVDQVFRQSSRGCWSASGSVLGPYLVPFTSASQDYRTWAAEADRMAAAEGHDLSAYDMRVYVMPPWSATYGGLAGIGGNACYIMRAYNRTVYAHEMGHCLGFNHSGTPDFAYGDASCPMGRGWFDSGAVVPLHRYNVANQHARGWLDPARVVRVEASGVYTIEPCDAAGTGPVLLRVQDGYETFRDLSLSYRQPTGLDGTLLPEYTAGLSLHLGGEYVEGGVFGQSYRFTTLLKSFQDGDSWTDAQAQMTFTQLSHTAAGVTVRIDILPDTEAPQAPVLSASSKNGYIAVSWTEPYDNRGISSYVLVRNNAVVQETSQRAYSDWDVVKGTSYAYQVMAVDTSGNVSPSSAPVTVTYGVKGGGKGGRR